MRELDELMQYYGEDGNFMLKTWFDDFMVKIQVNWAKFLVAAREELMSKKT